MRVTPMRDTLWLIMDRDGVRRMTKGRRSRTEAVRRPALGAGEYAVLVTVEIPDSVFAPTALPSATITVPESAVVAPEAAVTVDDPPPEADSTEPPDEFDALLVREAEIRALYPAWEDEHGPTAALCQARHPTTGVPCQRLAWHVKYAIPHANYGYPDMQPGRGGAVNQWPLANEAPDADAYDYAADDRNFDAARERGR